MLEIIIAVVVGIITGETVYIVKQYRSHARLLKAAQDVLTDVQERQRVYPGFYRQPHFVKVLYALADAIDGVKNICK
jgi:hypothetical protein